MLAAQHYRFGDGARETFARYLDLRLRQPHFANARSVRNALDRARLRQASRLFAEPARELAPFVGPVAASSGRSLRMPASVTVLHSLTRRSTFSMNRWVTVGMSG